MGRKTAVTLFAVFAALVAAATAARGLEVVVENPLANRVQVAFAYQDPESGELVTRGWNGVDPGTEKSFAFKGLEDASEIYVCAMSQGRQYRDEEGGDETVSGWIRNESFIFASEEKPEEGTNVKKVDFHQCRPSEDGEGAVFRADAVLETPESAAKAAEPARFIVENPMKNNVDVAVRYFDRKTGQVTTRGWFTVEAGKSRTLKFENASPGSAAYFHAEYKGAHYTDKTGDKGLNLWVSSKPFTFTGREKPTEGQDLRQTFFLRRDYSEERNAFVFRVDKTISKPKPKTPPKPAAKPAPKRPAVDYSQPPQISLSLEPRELLIGGRMVTTIKFTVDRECFVLISIYNEKGKLVGKVLHDPNSVMGVKLNKGSYTREFSAKKLDYGDYRVVIEAQRNFRKAKTSQTLSLVWRR